MGHLVIRDRRDEAGKRRCYLEGQWPDEIEINIGLFAQINPALVSVDGDMVRFKFENGDATYRVTGTARYPEGDRVQAALVACSKTAGEDDA